MSKRDQIELEQLGHLEAEFEGLLIPCLEQCARGRWGLFGAYDKFPELKRYVTWLEKDRLHELARTIRMIRSKSGETNELCEEFLGTCTLTRANDPGEPRLAGAFLERIERRAASASIDASPIIK